jgi:pimeloyl-ACP methyl ester carboxylesterase
MKISSSFIKVSLIVLVMLIIVYTFIGSIVRFMTYPAPSVKVPSTPPEPFKEIKIKYDSNDSVSCWLFENKTDLNVPIVLLFHGNGENLETMRVGGLLHQFINLHVHFLAVDYPRYGRSGGKPSEENIIAASNAAFHWIENNYQNNPKIIFGWSLGAAVAIQTVANYPDQIDGLIAVSPWTSLPDVAAAHYPRFLVNSLLKENYNSVEAAKNINCPSLIIHGEADNIIPFSQGKKVEEEFGLNARWVPVPHSGHNDIFSRDTVWEEISLFLEKFKGDAE